VLQLLKEQQLYAKPSKFFFGVKEVEYLGHILSHEGVKVDPNNIKAMMDCPIPKTLKNLKGYLGLTGYYCKFVKNYGRIVEPLMELTKNDSFSWTPEETKSFEQLKEVMCKAPVLTTLDFTKTFIVECDASRNGIGAVLMQEGRPLAFESRPLKGKDLHKPIYEKEMMAILHALKKWRPYLIGRHFKVKTDHDSLKYFLEQRLSFIDVTTQYFMNFPTCMFHVIFPFHIHIFPSPLQLVYTSKTSVFKYLCNSKTFIINASC
jgi:hypothetical protein